MKKNVKKYIAIASMALACLVGGLSTTTYGQETIQSILNRFQVGNMEITQYNRELPVNQSDVRRDAPADRQPTQSPTTTIEEARHIMDVDFPVPTWMPDGFVHSKTVLYSENGAGIHYLKDDNIISLLISKGENGISTTDEVRTETIANKTVYFVNGIVLWEQDGLTYEIYAMTDEELSHNTLEKIISTMSTGEDYLEAKGAQGK